MTRDVAPLLAAVRGEREITGAINSFVGLSPPEEFATCLGAAGALPYFVALYVSRLARGAIIWAMPYYLGDDIRTGAAICCV